MKEKNGHLKLRIALLVILPLLAIGAGLTGVSFYAQNCVFLDSGVLSPSQLSSYEGAFSQVLDAGHEPDRLYQALYYGLEHQEEEITLPGTYSSEQVQGACAALAEDYPHLRPAVDNIAASPGELPVAWLRIAGPIRIPAPRFLSPEVTILHVSQTALDEIADSVFILQVAREEIASHPGLAKDPQVFAKAYQRICEGQNAAAAVGGQLLTKEDVAAHTGPFDAYITPYYRPQLDERMGVLYDALRCTFEQGKSVLDLKGSYTIEEVDLALNLMKADYPQFPSSTASYSTIDSQIRAHSLEIADGVSIEIPSMDWTVITLSEIEMEPVRKNRESIPVAQAIVEEMPSFETEFEKAAYLYDYLVTHVTYQEFGEYGNDFSSDPEHYTLNAALLRDTTNCDGFASAMQLLLQMNGIECFKVYYDGEDVGEEAGHVWNMAKLDGQYYHMDASSGAVDRQDLQEWLQKEGLPTNGYTAREYFCLTTDEALTIYEAISEQVFPYLPESADKSIKQRVFDVVVSDSSTFLARGHQALANAKAAGRDYIYVSFASDALYSEFLNPPGYRRYGDALTDPYSRNGWYHSANEPLRVILYGIY